MNLAMGKYRFCVAALFISSLLDANIDPPEGFEAIFNGEDLSGWYGNNPHETVKAKDREQSLREQQSKFKKHWSIVDGELVNDGHGPYATTEKDYGDIELLLEYKTVALADSGIYLRGTPQVQIWDTTEAGGKWKLNAQLGSGGCSIIRRTRLARILLPMPINLLVNGIRSVLSR